MLGDEGQESFQKLVERFDPAIINGGGHMSKKKNTSKVPPRHGEIVSEDRHRPRLVTAPPTNRPGKKSGRRGPSQTVPATTPAVVEHAGQVQAESPPIQVASNHAPVQWKPWLDSYQHLRALQFHTREHFAAAAQLLWNSELRDLPYDLVGNHTIIVPAEAVPFFRGLELTETEVLHPGDVSDHELSELRKDQGPY
jgi:hypothetical protein